MAKPVVKAPGGAETLTTHTPGFAPLAKADMDRPIRRSSLTLKHKEHVITDVSEELDFFFLS
jgi:hypothetical protein